MAGAVILEGQDTTGVNPLRAWRLAKGLAVWRAAAMIGVSDSSIKTWEGGGQMPSEARMARIADVLGVDVDRLRRQWLAWKEGLQG